MKIARQIAFVLIIASFAISCEKENPVFLKNFSPNTGGKLYQKEIEPQDSGVLLATNEVNENILNVDRKYYYGFQKQLDDNHYLVSYAVTYQPTYRFTNSLVGWRDLYHCIYNSASNTIVSKLRVESTDPVRSYSEEKNGTYIIYSCFFEFIPVDSECNNIITQKDSLVSKYKIENNRFVAVK